ncbi:MULTISPECIES: potassium-transporting ATPase subunit F [Butyricimonas]|nr:potassium-transporting ATPase subunit F [Butyricimonas synergistica]
MYRLVRENLKGRLIMYTALFIISIIAFGYLMYVLVKPEKF